MNRNRDKAVDRMNRTVLISQLSDSLQEADLTVPPNCGGYGRIRHFRKETSDGWPSNPLPIVPACRSLKIEQVPDEMRAQLFQNAICPWRCWYCFVPYDHLGGDPRTSKMLTCEELVELYKVEFDRPTIIVLSGGSPGLVPEWRLWMMEALESAGLHRDTYLWSDDDLSSDFMFSTLSAKERARMERYENYGQVCCFKGYDPDSFNFNCRADQSQYHMQFELMRKTLQLDIDVYVYVTLTSPFLEQIKDGVRRFMDELQQLSEFLPLRTVPLEVVTEFEPLIRRGVDKEMRRSITGQRIAIDVWSEQIESRFSPEMRQRNIVDIPLR